MVSFPDALIKYSDKSTLEEKRFVWTHSSRFQSVTAGKSSHQKLEGVSPIMSVVRSREQWNVYTLALSSISLLGHTSGSFAWGVIPHTVGGFSYLINPNAHKPTCFRKFLIVSPSQVNMDFKNFCNILVVRLGILKVVLLHGLIFIHLWWYSLGSFCVSSWKGCH